ncbi:MAG TPA: alpha/beta fold hydrolase [Acidimicrobiales bacterium]|nr:alpha/beta fold hydrolase [Acidimicrobiales bacterium]
MVDNEIVERRVRVGGVELNVAVIGEGQPVILLHGWPDSWHLWRSQMHALAHSGHRAIAPDLRGFGESDHPEGVEEYSLSKVIGDVAGVMDAFGIESAAVVGHDWGAALAWLLAIFMPERVERLVAVSVGHPKSFSGAGLLQKQLSWYMLWFQFPGVAETGLAENDWEIFRNWAHGGALRGSDDYMERQIKDLSRPGRLTAGFNWYRANISPKTFAGDGRGINLPSVACPTMGVWSRGDMALGEAQMTGSAQFITGPWRYERIEHVGHWIPVCASEQLNLLLTEFLAN